MLARRAELLLIDELHRSVAVAKRYAAGAWELRVETISDIARGVSLAGGIGINRNRKDSVLEAECRKRVGRTVGSELP